MSKTNQKRSFSLSKESLLAEMGQRSVAWPSEAGRRRIKELAQASDIKEIGDETRAIGRIGLKSSPREEEERYRRDVRGG